MCWEGFKTLPESPNGWITEQVFLSFMKDVFIPNTRTLYNSNAVLIVANKTWHTLAYLQPFVC